jgi:hypothetical protein
MIIWINEVKYSPKRQKKLRKKIIGKFNNIGIADKKYHCSSFFHCQKLKSVSYSSISCQSWVFSCVVSVSPAALNTV